MGLGFRVWGLGFRVKMLAIFHEPCNLGAIFHKGLKNVS